MYASQLDGVIAYMDTTNHSGIAADASHDTIGRRHAPALPTFRLTARERQVVQLVAAGCSNDRIAERLQIRPQTVKNQLSRIYAKMGVSTRVQLAVYAVRHGLAEAE
jgi:two-component system, NarL family, nitrate/nitrite response regulator NarL